MISSNSCCEFDGQYLKIHFLIQSVGDWWSVLCLCSDPMKSAHRQSNKFKYLQLLAMDGLGQSNEDVGIGMKEIQSGG